MNSTYRLEVVVSELSAVESSVVDADGRLLERFDIGDSITLQPKFTSLRSSMSMGGLEILLFALSMPVGVASSLVATYLYDWLKQARATRVRLDGQEVLISDKDAAIALLLNVIEQKEQARRALEERRQPGDPAGESKR